MARRDPKIERRWRRLIERQERSGQTVRAFCETHGLNAWTFYSWRQELVRRDGQRPEGGAKFVAVDVKADELPTWPIEIAVDGVMVRVAAGADRRLVAEVMAGLKSPEPC
jgi:transposase-like protein